MIPPATASAPLANTSRPHDSDAEKPRPSTSADMSRRLCKFREKLEPLRAAMKASVPEVDSDDRADNLRRPGPHHRDRRDPSQREATTLCLQQVARKLARLPAEPCYRDLCKIR
jgi:hypothetical protein